MDESNTIVPIHCIGTYNSIALIHQYVVVCKCCNSLPNDKILDISKFKTFAGHHLKCGLKALAGHHLKCGLNTIHVICTVK